MVHATDARVRIEEKPEVRKAGGVFYTPQYIVEYIVQHTLGELLDKCKTPADAAKLKVLDPACGSGSFLLGAYAALIKWHTDWYSDKQRLTQQDREAAYYDSDGRVRLTAKLKRQILLNNLFGVDIDAQAVEVTRFSLSLKALEDTRRDELYEEVSLFKQSVLPDLRHNIKTGNSLIGPDYFTGQMMLDPDELLRVKPFDWANEFSVVMANGGFDAVIGNPPYIRIQTLAPNEITYFSKNYQTTMGNYDIYCPFLEKAVRLLSPHGIASYILPHRFFKTDYGVGLRSFLSAKQNVIEIVDFDGFMVFPEASINTCVVVLSSKTSDTFKFSQIRFIRRSPDEMPEVMKRIGSAKRLNEPDLLCGQLSTQTLTAEPWIFVLPEEQTLWNKMCGHQGSTLGDISTQIFQGLKTGGDSVFSVEVISTSRRLSSIQCGQDDQVYEIENELLFPQIKGGEMKRYQIAETNRVVIFPYQNGKLISHKILQSDFPMTWQYLKSHQKYLETREGGKMKGSGWYGYTRSQALSSMQQPKIVIPDYYAHASYAFDEDGRYFFFGGGAGGYGIVLKTELNPGFVLGLLNSKLLDWFLRKISVRQYQTAFSYVKKYIEQLPIRRIDFSAPADKARYDTMVQLVESMLALRKHKSAAQTQPEQELLQRQIEITDRQIDALVYELYELIPAEIAIVEGAG